MLELWSIQRDGEPYLDRYYVGGPRPSAPLRRFERWRWLPFTIYLHRIHVPDSAPDLHNHPWTWAWALILRGGYVEERGAELIRRRPGSWIRLAAASFHRIVHVRPNTWTLFLAGPRTGEGWGFLTPRGFVPHTEYDR